MIGHRGSTNESIALAAQLIANENIDVSSLITHIFPLAEINKAMDIYSNYKDNCIKVLITMPNR